MANFGNGIMGFFGSGGTGGGGGGTSTGINGLNGTTNIGLGGDLKNYTTIQGNNFDFELLNTNSINLESVSSLNSSQIVINNNQIQLTSTDSLVGIYSQFFVQADNIYSSYVGGGYGLQLNMSGQIFSLGDFTKTNGKLNCFVVNDSNNQFYFQTSYNQLNTDQDLFLASNESTSVRFVKIGDFNGYLNNISLVVDDANYSIYTTGTNAFKGFYLNFDLETYSFGATNSLIFCDAVNNYIEFSTDNLKFVGNITSSSGQPQIPALYWTVIINNTTYRVPLYVPQP